MIDHYKKTHTNHKEIPKSTVKETMHFLYSLTVINQDPSLYRHLNLQKKL